MEIASSVAHRVLKYAATVVRRNVVLSVANLHRYAESPFPKQRTVFSLPLFDLFVQEVEDVVDFLLRVGWISTVRNQEDENGENQAVKLTPVGLAVLAELEETTNTNICEGTETVLLDDNDPFSYARVVGRIVDHEECLIADPYFRLDQLEDIIRFTKTRRVLTSRKIGEARIAELATAVQLLSETQRPEIRVSSAAEFHDRYIISLNQDRVSFLGTSLNSVQGKLSLIGRIHGPVEGKIREAYNRLWSEADPLEQRND